jgi:hypothetical protein
MPTFFNFNNRKGVFMIPAGATKSPTPAPPSFSNTKSLSFDGVDEYVSLGDSDNFSFGNGTIDSPFSISCWVKIGQTTAQGIVTKYGSTNATREWLFYTTGAKLRLLFIDASNGANNFATGTTNLSINTWYHVACTYDGRGGSTAYNGINLYINGVAESVTTSGGSYTAMSNTTQIVEIGKYSTNELLGNIDEVSIFNTELSASDVTAIYNSGVPTSLSSYPSLVAWYRMGDNSTYQTPQILMPSDENKNKVSNYSLAFDGVDDYINIGNPTELQITGNLTLSAWVKRDSTSTSNNYMIIGKDNVTTGIRAYGLVRNTSTGKAQLNIWKSNVLYNVQSTTTINNDQWYHIMGVNDGSDLKIYVNGVLENTNVGGGGTIDNATIDFEIGRRQAFTNEGYWNGSIDEVAVWNSDQSANVSTIYNGGTPTTISGATAYWKLGEQATFSTNWTVPDQVGSNDGTSANMTIEDRVGDAPNSSNNAVSFNMEAGDIDNDTP